MSVGSGSSVRAVLQRSWSHMVEELQMKPSLMQLLMLQLLVSRAPPEQFNPSAGSQIVENLTVDCSRRISFGTFVRSESE